MIRKKGNTKAKTKTSSKKKRMTKSDRVKQRNIRLLIGCSVVLVILIAVGRFAIKTGMERRAQIQAQYRGMDGQSGDSGPQRWQEEGAPYIDVQLLTPNEYSRPQLPISSVEHIAIHYTANPGSTARANRDYFENLAVTQETKVSSHFVVGLEGEVVQCIPTSEMSYATNERNVDTLSIECCHPDEMGQFNDSTYDSVVKLTAWLCTRFGLTADDVIRHYDVTGKNCPKYYVENPDAWEQMKTDIAEQIQADYVLQENLGA